ncbi:MAG TPA: DUF1788 domain-containing protein [bacterium]|nr:DUF1788 domain-containing protein [bacterium]
MNEDLKNRLNKAIQRVQSKEFLESTGLGNEIAFYIFDYPPDCELEIRENVHHIAKQVSKKHPDIRIKTINLFELLIQYLKERNLLDKSFAIQREKGDEALMKALKGPLNETKVAEVFVKEAEPDKHDLILVYGVGSCYPMLRSHTLLNNLHTYFQNVPLVLFYPGTYDGQELKLFGKIKSNYYRAFRLVD